jgi:hypothetical protein
MLCLVKILDIKICRGFAHLVGMAALRAEFPALETIHVRKLPASRAADDQVHGNEVMRVILLKIYRYPVKIRQPVFSSRSRQMSAIWYSRGMPARVSNTKSLYRPFIS